MQVQFSIPTIQSKSENIRDPCLKGLKCLFSLFKQFNINLPDSEKWPTFGFCTHFLWVQLRICKGCIFGFVCCIKHRPFRATVAWCIFYPEFTLGAITPDSFRVKNKKLYPYTGVVLDAKHLSVKAPFVRAGKILAFPISALYGRGIICMWY